jgi:TRAP-type C4-dicarboxylate transport system permease large subunit
MSHGDQHGPMGRLLGPVAVTILGLLLVALTVGVAPNFDTRLVNLGESIWPGYAAELRLDPSPPDCDLDDLTAQLKSCPAEAAGGAAPAGGAGGDPFGGEDPLGEGDAGGDPFGGADPVGDGGAGDGGGDPFGGADPLGSEDAAGDDPFGGADPLSEGSGEAPAGDDPFGGADPLSEGGGAANACADDPFGGSDPVAAGGAATSSENCPALRALHDRCATKHADYTEKTARITGGVKSFRTFETAISDFAQFPYWTHLLSLVLLLGGFATTVKREHIALREPEHPLEHRIAQGLQLVVHLALAISAFMDWRVAQNDTASVDHAGLPLIWVAGFGALALVNVVHLVKLPQGLDKDFSALRLGMAIPLYVYMGIIGIVYFDGMLGHWSGQAIYMHKFVQHPAVYIGIGLYIWAGMMLGETRLAHRAFGLLTPWKFPPAILAWLVVVLAALPTAYSGASGIFVIAAGAVVFEQLRQAGASRRMALTATAMSGSLGVVLRPCLVVVLVAILNKQVTTDELFGRGFQVFLLTATLFLVAMLIRNKDGFKLAPVSEAVPKTVDAGKKVLPYVLISVGVLVFFAVVMALEVSEHTAAFMLPAILIAFVVFDTRFSKPDADEAPGKVADKPLPALTRATLESSGHIGALLMLMAGSVGLGGVVERAELMSLVPTDLGSPVTAMAILVVAMVLVGMTMDALGAVVLVSVTIAPLAYNNGIHPVHFWMMVLVAFELGYLTPPVAINHLLARQVIGKEARVEEMPVEGGWFPNNEHIWLPMVVMGTALVLVAFVPLLLGAGG